MNKVFVESGVMKFLVIVVLLAILTSGFSDGAIKQEEDAIILSGENYSIAFSTENGSIISVNQTGKTGLLLKNSELWQARFQDKTLLNAGDFKSDSNERSFKYKIDEKTNMLSLIYNSNEIVVTMLIKGLKEAVDFSAEITSKEKVVLDFAIPSRVQFDADSVQRFVYPGSGQYTVGIAFKKEFFKLQPQDRPVGWRTETTKPIGPGGYSLLYGSPLNQRPDRDPTVDLEVTEQGKKWLDEKFINSIISTKAVVNRPPAEAQADLIIVNSQNGPYFSASKLGGKGLIWRIGGSVGESEKKSVLDMVMAVVEKICSSPSPGKNKIGVISLKNGPQKGGWTANEVSEWLGKFRNCAGKNKIQMVEIANVQDMISAMSASDYLVILNPYGEWVPALDENNAQVVIESIGKYVRNGGNWFEVGGYPFYYALMPLRYLKMETSYPNAFADFMHLDSISGSISIYGVQPQKWQPWEGQKNKDAIFVPGKIFCGADEQSGYCGRLFVTYIEPGSKWRSPSVQFSFGKSATDDILMYCRINEIKRKLKEKMSQEVLEKFKKSVLVFYTGNCKEKMENLKYLPVPTLIHFSDYLKGGFDKQYPDHLPPHPNFGTSEEFRNFIDRSHELGHLLMPYTNPTWWCDHPKGPTFEREGDAPLLRTLDGKLSYEAYGWGSVKNDGFTVCHWHPAVQEANRKIVKQFSEEYPIDVLFQDQCGARGWKYDLNPSSPTAYAYADGLISMVAEDCKRKPLSTEDGWDRIVNYESQLCGMAWKIIPTELRPPFFTLMKYEIPPELWEIFPVAQIIAHDKTFMIYHDLGMFVTKRETIPWTLGLGYCMSYRTGASSLSKENVREWLKWLDRIQKSICYRYAGEPVIAFEHDRKKSLSLEDDGIIRATYGPVKIIANLGPKEANEDGHSLAPSGFYALAPGVIAGNLKRLGNLEFDEDGISFLSESDSKKTDVWVYVSEGQEVCVELPGKISGPVQVTLDDNTPVKKNISDNLLALRLPFLVARKRIEPPANLIGIAPSIWPGEKPSIGILEFEGVGPSWTKIMPGDWLKAFQNSKLFKDSGVSIKSIKTVEELVSALESGSAKWFAIINPYGEGFPAAGPGKWKEMLGRIQNYINNGGIWWETAGYTFYVARFPGPGGWEGENVGPSGISYFGIPVGSGAVDQPPELLKVTSEGKLWLGKDLTDAIEKSMSPVNRGLKKGSDDPGHITLVAGQEDFIGGYRLDGWGWFFRIGGFYPNPDIVLPVAICATEYVYKNPPLPAKTGGTKYLWHLTIK